MLNARLPSLPYYALAKGATRPRSAVRAIPLLFTLVPAMRAGQAFCTPLHRRVGSAFRTRPARALSPLFSPSIKTKQNPRDPTKKTDRSAPGSLKKTNFKNECASNEFNCTWGLAYASSRCLCHGTTGIHCVTAKKNIYAGL